MKIGIIQNKNKKECIYYVSKLVEAIEKNGSTASVADCREENSSVYDGADVIISVGGDGTFLKAASYAVETGVPVVGFNLGTLGMLTEFEKDDIETKIERILSGDYKTEERSIIDVYAIKPDGRERFLGRALNDCVVSRHLISGIAYINLYISGVLVDTYPCDGFIVATQTGSTAYSMSAGGPIVEPGTDVNIITPVCSHSLLTHPIVAKATSTVRIEICKRHRNMYAAIDGHSYIKLDESECIECRKSDNKLKILRIDPPNFYTALRLKFSGRSNRVAENEKE